MPPDSPEPSITSWMRLEPRSRNDRMAAGLQARIYDPLWMLARQWQFGEFAGEDNGSPIMARWRADAARLTRFHAGAIAPNTQLSAPGYHPAQMPLEALVEREAVRPPTQPAAKPAQLRLVAEAGQHFLRMLELQPISGDYRDTLVRQFPFPALTDKQRSAMDDASIAFCELMAGRVPDGRQLYAVFQPNAAGDIAIPPVLQIAPGDQAEVEKAARLWRQWLESLFSEPGAIPASWLPERLEYAFSVGTRLSDGERILTAQEYLGWAAGLVRL